MISLCSLLSFKSLYIYQNLAVGNRKLHPPPCPSGKRIQIVIQGSDLWELAKHTQVSRHVDGSKQDEFFPSQQ